MKVLHTLFVLGLLLNLLGGAALAEETSLSVSPSPSAVVSADDLLVSVSVTGPMAASMNLSQARLYIADREVTGMALRTDWFLSYRPLPALQPGSIQARLELPNGLVRNWTFQVEAVNSIESVTHSGKDSLGEYEELTVTLKGKPGQKAGYLFGDKEKEHAMVEQSPGLYIGTYTVQPGDYFLGEPVTGVLHVGTRVEKRQAPSPVTLFGQLFRVVILSPSSGSKVGHNFDIKGRTRPGSKVTLVPKLSFRKNTRAPNTRAGKGGAIEARADENGFFVVNYGVPMSLPNLSVVISVFAASPEGERSVPMVVRYHF